MSKDREPRPAEAAGGEMAGTRTEARPTDIGGQHRGIGSEGRSPYPSELLYIVREANIVEELDEVLADKGVELKGEQDG